MRVHAVQQRAVVADHQQAAGESLHQLVEPPAGVEVEVVGGLVEQQDVRLSQQLRRQSEGDDLAAAEGAQPPGQRHVAETEPVQLGPRAFLDVPVVADRGEVLLARIPGLDRRQRVEHRCDAQDLGHGQLTGQRQALREVAEHPGDGHGARAGPQLTGDQPEQGALAGAVRRDQAGAARAHRERQVLEDGGVVRPGERQVRTDDGRVGHAGDLDSTSGGRGRDQGISAHTGNTTLRASPGDADATRHGRSSPLHYSLRSYQRGSALANGSPVGSGADWCSAQPHAAAQPAAGGNA